MWGRTCKANIYGEKWKKVRKKPLEWKFLQLFFLSRKSSTEWKGKLLYIVGTMQIMWKWLDVFEFCIWIYWNEKFPSKFAAWSWTKKINLSEEIFHYFMKCFQFFAENFAFFFTFCWAFLFVCCFCLFLVALVLEVACLSDWCMRRNQKFPVLYYAFMARRFVGLRRH